MLSIYAIFEQKELTDNEVQKIISDLAKKEKSLITTLNKKQSQLTEKGVKKLPDSLIRKHAVAAANEVKKAKASEQVSKSLVTHFKELIQEGFEVNDFDDLAKYGISVIGVQVVSVLNAFFLIFFTSLFGGDMQIGMALTAIFIAPLTEETAKHIAIKEKAGGKFVLVFNILEMAHYMIAMLAGGVPFAAAFIARTIAAFFHYVTATVQRWFIYKYPNKPQEKVGLGLAMILHGTWNFFAVMSETFLKF